MDRASIVQLLLMQLQFKISLTVKWIRFKSDINCFLLLLKMMADILKFTDTPIIDERIEEYEYREYEPITGTSLNNGGDIRISIELQDVFTRPNESYLTLRIV